MATLAIGDVHGQLKDLRALLWRARPRPGRDRIVFVGDLVGRGPDSLGVLREVASMGDGTDVVLGNHDLHLLRSHYSGREAGYGLEDVQEATDAEELCAWLLGQPLAIGLPEAGAIVVHAGAWPSWDEDMVLRLSDEAGLAFSDHGRGESLEMMYGDDEDRWEDGLKGGRRLQATVNIMTRMRSCLPSGAIDWNYRGMPAESLSTGSEPWFDMQGRLLCGTLVVCGHWSTLGLFVRSDLAMIDTGCCFGQPLAGFWIEDRRLVFSR